MKKYYWTQENFGAFPPANWEEIANAVNPDLDEYAESHCINRYNDSELEYIHDYSERLMAEFCRTSEICGVKAVW